MRKLLSVLLVLTMLFSTVSTVAFAAPGAVSFVQTAEEFVVDAAIETEETADLTGETDGVDVWDGTVDASWYTGDKDEYVLTTAEQWAGFAYLVNGAQTYSPAMGNNTTADFGYYCGENFKTPKIAAPAANDACVDFDGVTIKLGADLDMRAVYENGELVLLPGSEYLTMMPVGYSVYTPFKGTFDGQGHTLSNIFQGMWDAFGWPSDNYAGEVVLGVFGYVQDAVIKNLVIDNLTFNVETPVGGVAGESGGDTTFENITIINSTIASGGGWSIGGIVGYVSGNLVVKNVDIDETNTVGAVGGGYDASVGGIIGRCDDNYCESVTITDSNVACKLDVYNDCVANYNTGVYRNCGMVIGGIGENNEFTDGGKLYPDFEAKNFKFENVKVTIGEWANYTYCWSYELWNNCQRVEPGIGYNGVDVSKLTQDYSIDTSRAFDAIFGAENARDLNNVRGEVDVKVMNFLGITGVEVKDYAKVIENPVLLYAPVATLAAIENKAGYIYVDCFESLEAALEAANDGDMLVLSDDIEVDTTVVINKDVTLDLNGNTITGTDKNTSGTFVLLKVTKGTEFTVDDSKAGGAITLTAENNRGWNAASTVLSNEGGNVTIKGGKLEHLGGSDMAYAIDNNSTLGETTLNVNGGELVSTYRAIRAFQNSTTANNVINIDGGRIDGRVGVWMQQPGASATLGELNITNGEFDCYSNAVVVDLSGAATTEVNISGGKFENENENANLLLIWPLTTMAAASNATAKFNITGGEFDCAGDGKMFGIMDENDQTLANAADMAEVSGGSFNQFFPEEYLAEDFAPVTDDNGRVLVVGERSFTLDVLDEDKKVKAGDTFDVTVAINGKDLANAVWSVTFNNALFELQVPADAPFTVAEDGAKSTINDFIYITDNTVFDDGEVLRTYTFKALAQEKEEKDVFALSNTSAYTHKESYDATDVEATYNEPVEVTIELIDYEITLKLDDAVVEEGKTADEVKFTSEPHTFVVETIPTATVTYTVDDGKTVEEVDEVSITKVGTYVITYTVTHDKGYAPVSGTFTLTVGDADYVVEVNLSGELTSDYVDGKKLVLVYTNTQDVFFKYDGVLMVDVSDSGYMYETHTDDTVQEYDRVFAYVTDAIDGGDLEAYRSKVKAVYDNTGLVTIDYSEATRTDLNFDNETDIRDITTAYGVLNKNTTLFGDDKYQRSILKADINGDKVVDAQSDAEAVIGVAYPS